MLIKLPYGTVIYVLSFRFTRQSRQVILAGGVIHKTIAMLHHVTTRVQHKDKYNLKHSVLNNIK